jgi:hypothetical protein
MNYIFEIVNPNGELLADLSGMAKARKIDLSRNEAEDIQFTINLQDFEKYCASLNIEPQNILAIYQNEVRVRRGSNYICGGQLIYYETKFETIEVRATGFLNLFKDRYTGDERIFTAVEATEIAETLIDETQAHEYGDFGVTMGTLETVGVHDRTYRRTNIKDALQNLTNVILHPFDFEFTYDKVFNAYATLGSQRPEIVFEFPRNIMDYRVPFDATGLVNHIIVLGSGNGDEALNSYIGEDETSKLNYKRRERVLTPNSVSSEDTLEEYAMAELAAWSVPFELPIITVDGNKAPFLGDYHLGDYVKVKLLNSKMTEHIDSMYRIEKIQIKVDDDNNETIDLSLSR